MCGSRLFFFFLEIGLRCSDLLQVPHVASGSAEIPFQVRSLSSPQAGLGPWAALVPGPPRE